MNATTSRLGTTKPTFWKTAREQLEAERATEAIGEKKFKNARAAKIAYTKAENAWEKARAERNAQWCEFAKTGFNEERFAVLRKMDESANALRSIAEAVYNAARAQGFYIRSWHFGYNATRDLIAANID